MFLYKYIIIYIYISGLTVTNWSLLMFISWVLCNQWRFVDKSDQFAMGSVPIQWISLGHTLKNLQHIPSIGGKIIHLSVVEFVFCDFWMLWNILFINNTLKIIYVEHIPSHLFTSWLTLPDVPSFMVLWTILLKNHQFCRLYHPKHTSSIISVYNGAPPKPLVSISILNFRKPPHTTSEM